MSNYQQNFIEERKRELEERQMKLLGQLKTFTNPDPHKKDNFNSDFPKFGDEEDDNAAEVAAYESNLHMEETLETSLEMITRALKKIGDGSYGICDKCGAKIEEDRLKVMPTATRCASKTCHKNV